MRQDLPALRARWGSRYPIYLMVVLMTASMAMILASTSINVAIPAIMADFAIGKSVAQWLSTGFLASMTAGLLLAAWSHARLGARRTLQLSLAIFVLGSLLALLAHSAWHLIAIRIVQGFCAGVIQPLSMVLIFEVFQGPKRGKALGLYGLCIMIAPTLGPSVSGYLIDHFDWHAVFWMPLPMCLLACFGASFLLPNVRERTTPVVDVLAFVYLCCGLFAGLAGLAQMQLDHWSDPLALSLVGVALMSAVAFGLRTHKSTAPLVPLSLWRNKAFRSASWVALGLGMGLYGSTFLLPLYLQSVEGYSAGEAGMLLLPTGIVLGIASYYGGRLTDRLSSATLLAAGLVTLALSMLGLAWSPLASGFWQLCFWACVGRLGLGILLPALTTGAMDALSTQELAHGAGAISFVRQLGGAFGINGLVFFLEARHGATGAELAAFNQTFYLMAGLFLLAVVAALRVNKSVERE